MSISERLKSYMDENKVPYSLMSHALAYTAQGVASALHVGGKELAKTVIVHVGDGEGIVLAVLPAPHHVDLKKLSSILGKKARLATEYEFTSLFPDCEPGAMPPLGNLYNLSVYVDESLAVDEEIVFNAGTHCDAMRIRFEDFKRLARPVICSFAKKASREEQ